jgi:galactitol-specific phosphotransferase system IIC component
MPDNPNFPSEFVAAAYFFPVSVLVAVTVTPGNGVLPLRAEPLIS